MGFFGLLLGLCPSGAGFAGALTCLAFRAAHPFRCLLGKLHLLPGGNVLCQRRRGGMMNTSAHGAGLTGM